ncbi:MAG: GBS Bsp-like repeat-containing protein [Hespellia sp.]|nr:GBS Bsp-like repeat-containing protein [Hespellia sp.]
MKLPDVKVSAGDAAGTQSDFQIKASGVGKIGPVQEVNFAVWSTVGGQDDLVWYGSSQDSNGVWNTTAHINQHKSIGTYIVDVYARLAGGIDKYIGTTTFNVEAAKANVSTSSYNTTTGGFLVTVSGVSSKSGVSKVLVPVWCASNQSDLIWYEAEKQSNGTYTVSIDPGKHGNHVGMYQIHTYIVGGNAVMNFADLTTQIVNVANYYEIMGTTTTTVAQMVRYYQKSGITYPTAELSKGGAGTIDTFCQMYYDEAAAEGVRAEVAFCQAMKETGWLKFGGQVSISQYNFSGLGATDDGASGASFPDVRTGIRAQIQHLKAYASKASLNNTCVDPRFDKVTRNTAPFVQWLGTKENPKGYGWATSANYGASIVTMIDVLKTK